jgi:oligopeptidase B
MNNEDIKPPVADKVATELEKHGDVRIDNYYWMRLTDEQRNDDTPDEPTQKVLDYLNAENDYFDKKMGHTEKFREDLFQEMKSRIKEDDESVPYKENGYFYITRHETGGQYPIYSRKKETLEADEEILFDVNKMAESHDYYVLRGLSVSPNNKLVSFGIDTVSRREYIIQFKDLETGNIYPEKIENSTGYAVWANDNETVFYTKKDPITLRSDKIYKHVLGTDPSNDIEIYHEKDDRMLYAEHVCIASGTGYH